MRRLVRLDFGDHHRACLEAVIGDDAIDNVLRLGQRFHISFLPSPIFAAGGYCTTLDLSLHNWWAVSMQA